MKIRDYTILEAADPQALKEKILEHARRGWEPLDGPFLVPYASGHGPVHQMPLNDNYGDSGGWIFVNFCQAMVLPWEEGTTQGAGGEPAPLPDDLPHGTAG